jgi:hypothetical protein
MAVKRKFPKKGFYRSLETWSKEPEYTTYYITGTTKGNLYHRPICNGPGWVGLLWTCVPTVTDVQHMEYSETQPEDTPSMCKN